MAIPPRMPDFTLELASNATRVAGVDEAGRGPLAGPVVAAAVVLDRTRLTDAELTGLNDSKKMTALARDRLFAYINATAEVGVGIADVADIDRLNILQASMRAMADAVAALPSPPDIALIDGNRVPTDLCCAGDAVVRGDGRSLSVAAASVIAKVTRDRIMVDLDSRYPGYGWARNAGYGTKEHLAALGRLGVTPHHRTTFAPVRVLIEGALTEGS